MCSGQTNDMLFSSVEKVSEWYLGAIIKTMLCYLHKVHFLQSAL